MTDSNRIERMEGQLARVKELVIVAILAVLAMFGYLVFHLEALIRAL